jgi:hypothetical protein
MTDTETTTDGYTIKDLGPDTWHAFADLAERHNGVWGGCWCTWFHTAHAEKGHSAEGNRALKERLVQEGRAHAALVFDGDVAVAWCEYGTPEELPNIYHRKEYEAELDRLPDYRITCFFVDRRYRRKGVAAVALRGRRSRPRSRSFRGSSEPLPFCRWCTPVAGSGGRPHTRDRRSQGHDGSGQRRGRTRSYHPCGQSRRGRA